MKDHTISGLDCVITCFSSEGYAGERDCEAIFAMQPQRMISVLSTVSRTVSMRRHTEPPHHAAPSFFRTASTVRKTHSASRYIEKCLM